MTFKERLKQNKPIILDGAMGTVLFSKGLETGKSPELLSITDSDLISSVHDEYINAGAEVVYTNTFGANAYKLGSDEKVQEVVSSAVALAKTVANKRAFVALDIGPIGKLFEPSGPLTADEAYNYYKEIAIAGERAGADLVVMETFSSLGELRQGVLAVKENTDLPVVTTMTFERDGRTFTGVSPSAFALTMTGLGVDALGVNCSLGPNAFAPIIREIARYTDLPLVAKPNAGLPNEDGKYTLTPTDFAEQCKEILREGAVVIGGCCGTSPDFIRALCRVVREGVEVNRAEKIKTLALCSATNTVLADKPLAIGERLNPTGKKRLKEAYLSGDEAYILSQAVEQTEAGASLLDINTGVPGADEKSLMKKAVLTVSSVSPLPLSIDSPSAEALEAGLRAFVGKAIVNSVNGERSSMDKVFPLVKKYGSAVIGLCLDENGVPNSAKKRYEIAERIVREADKYGIARENIIIDCLTLTVSAEPTQAIETLNAIKMVKEGLGVKTALGVSNISFGLPERDYINSAFLVTALSYGLDFAIINPNSSAMAYALRAHAVLFNYDKNAEEYISACTDEDKARLFSVAVKKDNATTSVEKIEGGDEKKEFTRLIVKGLTSVKERTASLLQNTPALEVVNEYLIPALDEVGRLYEAGKIFLPQLITSAETAKLGFDEVKKAIKGSDGERVGETIVLATVKGDIHDIGKNIVKVVLENYGYNIIDLGKNTDIDLVVSTVKEKKVRLVGLSALMTTTVINMEETVKKLKENCPDCAVMVGGAVLTDSYAKKIGADYYAKDANASVSIAKKVFGE